MTPSGSRVPDVPDGLQDEGLPQGDTQESKEATGDPQEGIFMPRDRSVAVEDYGTTEEEEAEGESLDGRLARKLPDTLSPEVVDGDADDRTISDEPFLAGPDGYDVGRLVEPDEGARTTSAAELTASSAGTDEGGFSSEEAAMHIDQDS